jgi:heme exporter protein A
MLTLENISCYRSGRILFKKLGFTLGDSCILIIRGENGCGKTTLLETIACLRKPEQGAVLYANKSVLGENYKEYCDIITYVGHRSAVKPQLTVYENIEFWASLKGNSAAVNAAIFFFGLSDYKNTLCANLSAGYKKRVALARLMVSNSEIWLLDEPFVNLDEFGRNALATLAASRIERGGSVIITAHGDVPFGSYAEINLEEFRSDN